MDFVPGACTVGCTLIVAVGTVIDQKIASTDYQYLVSIQYTLHHDDSDAGLML
jgi:hypothetical protein